LLSHTKALAQQTCARNGSDIKIIALNLYIPGTSTSTGYRSGGRCLLTHNPLVEFSWWCPHG